MSFFDFWTESIAIDLGTANTLIIHNDKVVVDSPSIVAIDQKSGKIIAVGKEAKLMHGKTHENIKTIRPLKDGVIADFNASEQMIGQLIKSIPTLNKRFYSPSLKMVICIPSGITEVEMRAVRESAERVNGKEVYLIHEPMAAAIGIGVDINQPKGNMIIDIGGGTTEIAVIALAGIVCDKSVKIAGDVFTEDIVFYMRTQHNLSIGDRTAEKIKISIGSALDELENPPENLLVQGRDLLSGKPKEISIGYREISKALDKSIIRIEESVMETLSQTPPELAADIGEVPLIILARTDANAAKLITNDFDENDKPFLTGERSPEGFFYVKDGIEQAISRGLAYAPYADLIWCETATPNLAEAKKFADAIHEKFPGKLLAYNCSPSFNWKKHLNDDEIATFQQEIAKMGYKFQFITLAGFHTQNIAIFELAEKYKKEGMAAYSRIQQQEFAREKDGYTSVKHQREVGTSYFDAVSNTISSGQSSTTAMAGSTETEQF